MAANYHERVSCFLREYVKYFRCYFSSSFEGNEEGRRFSAYKVRELDQIARRRLKGPHLHEFTSQRDEFRRSYFERYREWILVSCENGSAPLPEFESYLPQ